MPGGHGGVAKKVRAASRRGRRYLATARVCVEVLQCLSACAAGSEALHSRPPIDVSGSLLAREELIRERVERKDGENMDRLDAATKHVATHTRAKGNVTREIKTSGSPTVIKAGASKLNDANAPLVIEVTPEQARRIADFTQQ